MAKKKRFLVVPRTENAMKDGIKTTKGNLDFGGKTAKYVDEGLANEINTQHGLKGSGDVWVEQDERLEWHEGKDGNTDGRNVVGIHNYTFGSNHAFRDAWAEFEKRRKDKINEAETCDNRDADNGEHKDIHRNVNHKHNGKRRNAKKFQLSSTHIRSRSEENLR